VSERPIKLVTIVPHMFAGRWHRLGDRFEANRTEASILVGRNLARTEAAVKVAPSVHRRYKRRDMQAEE
jgi:hypothetical protein